MKIWVFLIVSVLLICVSGAMYLSFSIAKFDFIEKITKGRKWLSRLVSFGLIVIFFLIIARLFSLGDAAIVFIHVVFFFLLSGIIVRIINAVRGKETSFSLRGCLALVLTIAYLSVGYYQCMNVWETNYVLSSDKVSEDVRIALIADSHIGTTFDGDGFANHINEIMRAEPDCVMIAGDFVDDSTKREDLIKACEALEQIKPKYRVWYVYGNHDKGYYQSRAFTATELDETLRAHNINVMEDEVAYAGDLCIVGRKDGMTTSRLPISELIKEVDSSKYTVVLNHEPTDYENESLTNVDLVLSGHTHGGQFIPLGFIQEALGINDGVYGHKIINDTNFIVTSGISNWEFHFKTGTKSEYVIIDIK